MTTTPRANPPALTAGTGFGCRILACVWGSSFRDGTGLHGSARGGPFLAQRDGALVTYYFLVIALERW